MSKSMCTIAAILLLITQSVRVISRLPNQCRLTRALSDHVLSGHTFKTIQGTTLERCTFHCEMEENCLSINYLSSTRTCEYNNKNLELSSFDMRKKNHWVYIGSVVRNRPYSLHYDCFCHENNNQENNSNSLSTSKSIRPV